MIFQQILNKDSGLSARAKLNTMLSALIESEEGVNAAWIFLRSLEKFAQNLSSRESNDVAVLEERISGANDYTDRSISKLYTYVDGMEGGVGGLIDSPSFDPSTFPADKAITLIALGAGTFTNLHDITDTPITVSQSNSITVFYRAAYVTYWNYKTQVLQAPPMDSTPAAGNTDHVVSSAGIHQFVLAHGFNEDIDIVDTTDSALKTQCITYTMRKNHGTEEDPNYETIATFTIPTATLIKAGLMPPYIDGIFDVNRYTHSSTPMCLEDVLRLDIVSIPIEARRSGMRIQFLNEDGEVEQWRFLFSYENTTAGNEQFLDPSCWRGMDAKPTRDSHNCVESGGVFTFANRVIFVKHWGSFLSPQPLPLPELGQYLYNTHGPTLSVGEIDPTASEEEEEDVVVWKVLPLQEHTLYINGKNFVSYIWDGEIMKPITKFLTVVEEDSETTDEYLTPNTLFRWGVMSEITILGLSNAIEGYVNEYMMEFTVDGDNFNLTLPEGVRWVDEPTWENGYTYQVSIVDNLAVCAGWGAPEEDEPL